MSASDYPVVHVGGSINPKIKHVGLFGNKNCVKTRSYYSSVQATEKQKYSPKAQYRSWSRVLPAQLNKSGICPLKCWLSSRQVSSCQPPCPCSKVTSSLCSGQTQLPHTCPRCSGCSFHPGKWLQGRFPL